MSFNTDIDYLYLAMHTCQFPGLSRGRIALFYFPQGVQICYTLSSFRLIIRVMFWNLEILSSARERWLVEVNRVQILRLTLPPKKTPKNKIRRLDMYFMAVAMPSRCESDSLKARTATSVDSFRQNIQNLEPVSLPSPDIRPSCLTV